MHKATKSTMILLLLLFLLDNDGAAQAKEGDLYCLWLQNGTTTTWFAVEERSEWSGTDPPTGLWTKFAIRNASSATAGAALPFATSAGAMRLTAPTSPTLVNGTLRGQQCCVGGCCCCCGCCDYQYQGCGGVATVLSEGYNMTNWRLARLVGSVCLSTTTTTTTTTTTRATTTPTPMTMPSTNTRASSLHAMPVCGSPSFVPPAHRPLLIVATGFRYTESAGCVCDNGSNAIQCVYSNVTIFDHYNDDFVGVHDTLPSRVADFNNLCRYRLSAGVFSVRDGQSLCLKAVGFCDPLQNATACCAVAGCAACPLYVACAACAAGWQMQNGACVASPTMTTVAMTLPSTTSVDIAGFADCEAVACARLPTGMYNVSGAMRYCDNDASGGGWLRLWRWNDSTCEQNGWSSTQNPFVATTDPVGCRPNSALCPGPRIMSPIAFREVRGSNWDVWGSGSLDAFSVPAQTTPERACDGVIVRDGAQQHVWAFAIGMSDTYRTSLCPCNAMFIGNNDTDRNIASLAERWSCGAVVWPQPDANTSTWQRALIGVGACMGSVARDTSMFQTATLSPQTILSVLLCKNDGDSGEDLKLSGGDLFVRATVGFSRALHCPATKAATSLATTMATTTTTAATTESNATTESDVVAADASPWLITTSMTIVGLLCVTLTAIGVYYAVVKRRRAATEPLPIEMSTAREQSERLPSSSSIIEPTTVAVTEPESATFPGYQTPQWHNHSLEQTQYAAVDDVYAMDSSKPW